MATKWNIDSDESDVLIKMKHSIIAYLSGHGNTFSGSVAIKDDEVEDVSVAFSLDVNNKDSKQELIENHLKINDYLNTDLHPLINFRSTSFQKVSKNINFLKGNLTVNDNTKVIELDTAFLGYNFQNGIRKASFEVKGIISRADFNLKSNTNKQIDGLLMGQDLHIEANLEFTA